VRGVFSFVQSLTIGVKTLMYSAQFFEDEEEEAPKKEKKKKKEKTKEQESRAEKAEMAGTVTFSDCAGSRTFYVASGVDCIAVRCCDKKPCADRTD